MPTSPWVIEGEVYAISGPHVPADSFEYTVSLTCAQCGKLVDEWDSGRETANEIQFLTEKEAAEAWVAIQTAVERDPRWVTSYFDLAAGHVCQVPDA